MELLAPAFRNSCWIAPMPPPMSSRVPPSIPSALSASIKTRVVSRGPLLRYCLSFPSASLWSKNLSMPCHWRQTMGGLHCYQVSLPVIAGSQVLCQCEADEYDSTPALALPLAKGERTSSFSLTKGEG